MPGDNGSDLRASRSIEIAAAIALAAGGLASLAFTLYAGLRIGSPLILLVLFGGWVAFPFIVLAAAHLASRRRSAVTHRALCRSALVVSLGSVAAYGAAATLTARPPTAVFVLVAPLSLLLTGLLVPAIVLRGGRRS